MRQTKILIALFVAFAFVGCTRVQFQEVSAPTAPSQGKGLVYFFADKEGELGKIRNYIYGDGNRIGFLQDGIFFFVELAPGDHLFVAQKERKSELPVTINAGGVYYVKVAFLVNNPDLKLVDEAEGRAALATRKYAVVLK